MMEEKVDRPIRSFRDLRVWQDAFKLSIGIYKICEGYPEHEKYALSSQMRRAAVSVCSNIAEGFGRRGTKEKDQFYGMANGSLTELENQILIAEGVGYISKEFSDKFMSQCGKVHRQLITLQKVNSKRS